MIKAKNDSHKKKKNNHVLMKLFFTLFIAINIILTVTISYYLMDFLHKTFEITYKLPNFVWIIIICSVLGSAVTTIFSKFFLNPILKLAEAMGNVANGKFETRLKTEGKYGEIKQIYGDFNSMAEKLGSTEKLQSEFISNVSHEFKTPINAIEGYATLLQDADREISIEQREYIDKILFNTKRLTNLVGNILLLSKVDAQNTNISEKVNTYRLDEQIRQSIVLLESRWVENNNDFDVDLSEIYYTGNETFMGHVFLNLIENAIKYGKKGGLIKMRLWEKDEEIIFTIDDEGEGISLEAQKHIFERFYQADNSRKAEGNGLGLALVKRIVDFANGEIFVENLEPCGCRFTVKLRTSSCKDNN